MSLLQSDLAPLARLHPLTTPLQVSLLQSDLEMQLGTGSRREWARVSIELSSTRELRYKCAVSVVTRRRAVSNL